MGGWRVIKGGKFPVGVGCEGWGGVEGVLESDSGREVERDRPDAWRQHHNVKVEAAYNSFA